MKTERRRFEGAARGQADGEIAENFLSAFGGYGSFFIYNGFSSEADTKRIISALLAAGKRVYLPRVEGKELVAAEYGETRRGAYGIEEPVGRAFAGDIDVTVIPLLAVNERGYRLGYGGGYYDRRLKGAKTVKVGLGYYFQMQSFKEDLWDEPLDYFICEKGLYKF